MTANEKKLVIAILEDTLNRLEDIPRAKGDTLSMLIRGIKYHINKIIKEVPN